MIDNFLRGMNNKPIATLKFEELVATAESLNGEVIYGYPCSRMNNRLHIADAILVSNQGQVTALHFVEDADPEDYRQSQDDIFNLLEYRLRENPDLLQQRKLRVKVQTATFGPNLTETNTKDPDHPVFNPTDLVQALTQYQASPPENMTQETIVDTILSMPNYGAY